MTASPLAKTATGITGFDDISGGGLPQGRTTLLLGGPGSGKRSSRGNTWRTAPCIARSQASSSRSRWTSCSPCCPMTSLVGAKPTGCTRWEKERAVRLAGETAEVAARLKRMQLDTQEAELEVRLKSLQTELVAKRTEKSLLARATESREGEASQGKTQLRELRGADDAPIALRG